MASRWQVLDRPAEFDSVRATLNGGNAGVVLIGAAGVGKTTLARTVTNSLRSDVHWVGCTESSRSIRLGVFAHRILMTGSRDPIALLGAARESILAVEAEALHHAARFGDHTVADRLSALADQVDGAVVALYARHAAAVADGDAQALDVVSVEFEASGLLLSAADSAAQAVPLHARSEGRTESVQSASRALRLATQCGGAATPAIRYAAQPLPLSSREREIGSLVASGLTSREIAEQLTVSVRTVEGHIYRACIKLGVADRGELGKIIRRDLRLN